ncbi:uncharacterized protein LOC105846567 isoform X5 [Hydra vulgaris]
MTMQNNNSPRKRGRPNRSQNNVEPSRLLLQLLPRTSSFNMPCLPDEENPERKKKVFKRKGSQKVISLKAKNRESHNADEKRRKEKLNKLIVKLKDLLGLDGKKSKVAILEKAVEFVSKEKKEAKNYDMEYVNQKIKSLESIIVSLIDLLSCNSVSLPSNIQVIKTSSKSDVTSESTASAIKDVVHIVMDSNISSSQFLRDSIIENTAFPSKLSKENLSNSSENSLINFSFHNEIMLPGTNITPTAIKTLKIPSNKSTDSISNNPPEIQKPHYHVNLNNGLGLLNINPKMSITQITIDQKHSHQQFSYELNNQCDNIIKESINENLTSKSNESENINLPVDDSLKKQTLASSLPQSETLTSEKPTRNENSKTDTLQNRDVENPVFLNHGKVLVQLLNGNLSNDDSFRNTFPVKTFGIDNLISNTNVSKNTLLKSHNKHENQELSCSGHTVEALLDSSTKNRKLEENSVHFNKDTTMAITSLSSSITERVIYTESLPGLLPQATVSTILTTSHSLFDNNLAECVDKQSNTLKRWTNVVSNAQNSNMLIASFPLLKKTVKFKTKKQSLKQKKIKNGSSETISTKASKNDSNVSLITCTPRLHHELADNSKNKIGSDTSINVTTSSCIVTSSTCLSSVVSSIDKTLENVNTVLTLKNAKCVPNLKNLVSATEVFNQPLLRTMKDRTIRNKWLERDKTYIDVASIDSSFEQQASPVISFPYVGCRKRNIDILSPTTQPFQKRTFSKPSSENRTKVASRARSFSVESLSKSAIQTYNDKQLNLPLLPVVSSYSSNCPSNVQKLKHQPDIPIVTPLPTILNIFAPAQVPVSSMQQGNLSNFSAENHVTDGCGLINESMEENSFNPTMFMAGNQQMFTNYSTSNLINSDQSSFPYAIDNLISQNTTPMPIWSAPWISQDYNCDFFNPIFSHMHNNFNRRNTTECSPIKSIISILQSTSNQPNQNIQFNQISAPDFPHTQNSMMQNYTLPDSLTDEQVNFSNNFNTHSRHTEAQSQNGNNLQLESMQNSCELRNNRINNSLATNENSQLNSDLYNTPPVFPFSQWQDFQTKNKIQ